MKVRIKKVIGKKIVVEVITTKEKKVESKTFSMVPVLETFNERELASQVTERVLGYRDLIGNNHPKWQKRYIVKYPFSLKQVEGLWLLMDVKTFVKRYSDDSLLFFFFRLRKKIECFLFGFSWLEPYEGDYRE